MLVVRSLLSMIESTENAIARLDVKELAEREFQETISEPTELTGEFRDKSDMRT